MTPYKWAYNAKTDELQVWPVENDKPWATPQHGQKLSEMEYLTLYQGRIVMDGKTIAGFTFYGDRPYIDRTDEGVKAAEAAIDEWVANQE